MSEFVYHAGTEIKSGILWSYHSRLTYDAATREARRMARKHGGRPLVEWWHRDHGLHPGNANVVLGADYVDE